MILTFRSGGFGRSPGSPSYAMGLIQFTARLRGSSAGLALALEERVLQRSFALVCTPSLLLRWPSNRSCSVCDHGLHPACQPMVQSGTCLPLLPLELTPHMKASPPPLSWTPPRVSMWRLRWVDRALWSFTLSKDHGNLEIC